MEYKVSFRKDNDLQKNLIKTFLNCVLVIVFLFYLMDFLYPEKFQIEFFYLRGFLLYLVLFMLNFRSLVIQEELTINPEYIHCNQYGKIMLEEILHYKIRNFKGQINLILKFEDGRKISFGPRNSIKKSDRVEFNEFLVTFENNFNCFNKVF